MLVHRQFTHLGFVGNGEMKRVVAVEIGNVRVRTDVLQKTKHQVLRNEFPERMGRGRKGGK